MGKLGFTWVTLNVGVYSVSDDFRVVVLEDSLEYKYCFFLKEKSLDISIFLTLQFLKLLSKEHYK